AGTIIRLVGRTSLPGAGQPLVFLIVRCYWRVVSGARFCLQGADVVTIGRAASLSMERHEEGEAAVIGIGIPDPRLSSTHARLQSVLGNWVVQDAGSKNGTWVDGRRVSSAPLVHGALVE